MFTFIYIVYDLYIYIQIHACRHVGKVMMLCIQICFWQVVRIQKFAVQPAGFWAMQLRLW